MSKKSICKNCADPIGDESGDDSDLMEDNGHIAKMKRDAIMVCDKNLDSATSNQLQDILDKQML